MKTYSGWAFWALALPINWVVVFFGSILLKIPFAGLAGALGGALVPTTIAFVIFLINKKRSLWGMVWLSLFVCALVLFGNYVSHNQLYA